MPAGSGAWCAGGSPACRPTSPSANCSGRPRSSCSTSSPDGCSSRAWSAGSGPCAATTPSSRTRTSSATGTTSGTARVVFANWIDESAGTPRDDPCRGAGRRDRRPGQGRGGGRPAPRPRLRLADRQRRHRDRGAARGATTLKQTPESVASASNVTAVSAFESEVTVRRTRFSNPETGWAVVEAACRRRRAGRARRPADPPRGARARARVRDLGRGQPLRPAGQGHRGEPAAAVGPDAEAVARLPASASSTSGPSAPQRLIDRYGAGDDVRRDRRRPARGLRRRRAPRRRARRGHPLVGAAAGHPTAAPAARAARPRLPGDPDPRDLRRRRPPRRVRAAVRADQRVRRRLPDRRPDRAQRSARPPTAPSARAPAIAPPALRGRARRQHLHAARRCSLAAAGELLGAEATERGRHRPARRGRRPRPRGALDLPRRRPPSSRPSWPSASRS